MPKHNWYENRTVLLYEASTGVDYTNGTSHPIWVLEGLLKAMSLINECWLMDMASQVDATVNWEESEC